MEDDREETGVSLEDEQGDFELSDEAGHGSVEEARNLRKIGRLRPTGNLVNFDGRICSCTYTVVRRLKI